MVPNENGFNQSETASSYATVSRDVFHARHAWQGMVKLYKGGIFVITETQIAIQIQVKRNNQTTRNFDMWMQQ